MQDFEALMERELAKLSQSCIELDELRAATDYCMLGGGKRLRPRVLHTVCAMLGVEPSKAMPLCLSLELIHGYSLVHDDLPAMDNDAMRRGKPSCHKAFGEAQAILCGDALLTMAQLCLCECEAPSAAKAELMRAALYMVEGQYSEFLSAKTTPASLLELYAKKTGALFTAAVLCAGRLAGYEDDRLEPLRTFGQSLGLLFQLTDDIIDSDRDAEEGKPTYLSVAGWDETHRLIAECEKKCLEFLESYDNEAMRELRTLIHRLTERTE